ncbi:hypothetical protein [Anaerophaga thermohalophila]|uniref:hypothetical protein n=1 Tax=Anaerophaga thermohalophila TaxID=177400 RepID=UPI000237C2BF|nr:hypothetical protein [Anaerophaga thermohalophila]
MISKKFKTAKENEDYYEMRRLTYWALRNNFNSDWNEDVTFGFDLPIGNPVATLRHHEDAKYGGVRVYYTYKKYIDGKFVSIRAKEDPFYFPPHMKMNGKYFDAYFPVDVKLYEGDKEVPTGNTYYGDNDFVGKYSESGLILGISNTISVGKGSGFMVGYLRGFGYCEYNYNIKKGPGINITLNSSGVISGKYLETRGEQTPYDLSGQGGEISYSAGIAAKTEWESYKLDGITPVFKGTTSGITIGYSKASPPGSLGKFNTCTLLLFPLKSTDDFEQSKKSYNECCEN